MSSLSRQYLEDWLKDIEIEDKNAKVLDIGGSQNPINKRLKKLDVKDIKILDLEKPHECKQSPDIFCDLNTCLQTGLIDNFDIAFCIEVSEYWWNPVNALKIINDFLTENGTLYISFHFIYPVHNPVEQDYLRYTPRGAEKLLENAGFKIVEMKPRLLETYVANIDGMRPAKSYDMHTWQGCLIKAIKIK